MYPYHNSIRQRIYRGELIGWEYVDAYPHIGRCLVLHFSTPPFDRPIRPHRWSDYEGILKEWEKKRR